MEGRSPYRDRSTTENVPPPLAIRHDYAVGGDTQYASPVGVVRELLLVEGERKLHVLAAGNGQEKWQFNLPGFYVSPAVAGNRVFVRAESGTDGYVLALALDSGAKLWQFKFPGVGSAYDDVGGHVTSPLVAGGRVLIGASYTFYALDAETGGTVWTFGANRPVSSSAAVADETVYFTDFSRLYAVDVRTGVERWHFEHGSLSLLFAPIVAGDQVVLSTYDTLYALDRKEGRVTWTRKLSGEQIIPAAASDGEIYVKTANRLYALDRDGTDLWAFEATNFVSLPAVTSQQIYVITRSEGSAQLRALRRSDGHEIWQVDNLRLANAAPVVAGGRVYVRTVDGSVLAFSS